MARLGDICKFQSGGTPSKSNPLYFGGTIPWITTVALNGNIIDENNAVDWITEKALAESAAKIVPANSIMVGTRVGIGKVAINSVPMSTSQDIISLLEIDESRWNKAFICKWLSAKSEYLQSKARGATIKGIKIETISDLEIPEILIENQQFISVCLDRVSQLISLRKQQLAKLDEFVKARFVEMFGDPVQNSFKYPSMPMTELCEIIDGDRGENYPKQEEFFWQGYCLFLNAKNVTSSGFSFDTCMFITEDKDKRLRKGKLHRGDIVLTTRGTIGNLAFYDTTIPFEHVRINSGMVILRIDHKILEEYFFIEQFKMLLPSIKERIASGSAQPQLPISTMNKIKIILPDVSSQRNFSIFVREVARQKLTIQQSLDKLEVLKKSLMQEYFG